MNQYPIPGLRIWGLLLSILLAASLSKAQPILLEEPVKTGDLTLFPKLNDPNTYFYLPDQIRLATHADGSPQFSFIQYVENVRSGAGEDEAREGMGGGIVHAVVNLSVSEAQMNRARQELRRLNPAGVIQGPIIYRSGTISLISSFTAENGDLVKQVVGLGKAPLLDGQKAAISVQLTKKGAQILWASFQTPTPDFSISFEMELTGYLSPKSVKIEADFEQIYEYKGFDIGLATPILAAEIKASYEDLTKTGAIKVTQIGEDEKLDNMMTAAYDKLLKMMFDPVGGTGTPNLGQLAGATGSNQPSMLDRATTMLQRARDEARQENREIRAENNQRPVNTGVDTGSDSLPGARAPRRRLGAPTEISDEEGTNLERTNAGRRNRQRNEVAIPSMAIAASFQFKRIRQRGKFTIDLNKYTTGNLSLRFDQNLGGFKCKKCFTRVNLDDPLYKQRELVAFVDGMNAADFGNYINFASVIMRKTHQNGEITLDEIKIDRNNFNKEGNNFKMLYGWKGDDNREEWFNYEYKTIWNYFGGYTADSDWQTSIAGVVPLTPNYLKRTIDLEADPDIIAAEGVRMIEVKLFYKMGDREESVIAKLNTRKDEFSKQVSVILPRDNQQFEYEATWYKKGGQTIKSGRQKSESTILFLDEFEQ